MMPIMPPRQNVPTRKDLEFLLGGPPRVRERSSTPNFAGLQARQVRASVAPVDAAYIPTAPQRSVSAAVQYQYQPDSAPAAGPSRASVQPRATARPPLTTLLKSQPSDVFPGDEEPDARIQDFDEDDGLALGAEAVMESDHDASYADNEDDTLPHDHDDPNDQDFRPNNSAKRLIPTSRTSAHAADASGSVSTPPRARVSAARRSLASSSTAGKVPGSTTKPDASADPPRKGRSGGRWRKDQYTPEVLETIKAANEILAVALEASADQPSDRLARRKNQSLRLDDVLDRKVVQSLSPEMQAALRRARNAQLQRERRERIRAETGWTGTRRPQATVHPPEGASLAESSAGEEKKRGRKRKAQDRMADAEGEESGSGIVERARGKVLGWIKNVSSEAEMSVEPEPPFHPDGQGEHAVEGSFRSEPTSQPRSAPRTYQRRSVSQTHSSAAIASLPADQGRRASSPLTPASDQEAVRKDAGGLVEDIDPRLQDPEAATGGEEVFSRFGTVTGKLQPIAPDTSAPTAAPTAELGAENGIKPDSEAAEMKDNQPYEAGALGDEYYFSN